MSNPLARPMPLGPVMLDVAGKALTDDDRDLLLHPAVGGVILFSRNYESPEQVAALVSEIHALRTPPLLVGVDHEGGRVQRFREGFTRIPPMGALGALHDTTRPVRSARPVRSVKSWPSNSVPTGSTSRSRRCWISITAAAASSGIGPSTPNPGVVATLASAFVDGLAQGGMGAVGKHFPGHGFAEADTHTAMAVDDRSLAEISAADLVPFARLVSDGLTGIMPAHVIYPAVDSSPAGFSELWLRRELRERLGFTGVIFSDDLSMAGAHSAGGIRERARAALDAGCDMVLVCNDSRAARTLVDGLDRPCSAPRSLRWRASTGIRDPPDSLRCESIRPTRLRSMRCPTSRRRPEIFLWLDPSYESDRASQQPRRGRPGTSGAIMEFDFQEWASLAKDDPDAFERKRQEAIEAYIARVPEGEQQRLRGLQFRIDMERQRASNPLSACIRINKMMMDQFTTLRGALDELKSEVEGHRPSYPRAEPVSAEVLRFPSPQ
jgi:beta-N-acetylhexosaminidase